VGISTPGIQQKLDPVHWRQHLFGLPKERWKSLSGRSFWVTGAGTGYGRCLTVALAAAEAQVFLTGRRKQKLEETLQEIECLGISPAACQVIPVDITDVEQVKRACEVVMRSCETLYGLVNNAALPSRGDISKPLLQGSLADWERIMRTNVTAPWLLTRGIFPHMVKGEEVRVLLISSEAGWTFTSGFGPYNVSKAALNSLGGSMAAEYAVNYPNADIQINVLVPGEARTEMNQGSNESPYAVVNMALILLSHPKGGPNGKFFHRDGRHLEFGHANTFERPLI